MRNTHYIFSILLTLVIAALSLYPIQQPEILKPIVGIDKLVHAGMYALLALVVYAESRKGWIALVWSIACGGIMELLQAYCTHGMRSGDWWDWAADIVGAAIGVSIIVLVKRFRQ